MSPVNVISALQEEYRSSHAAGTINFMAPVILGADLEKIFLSPVDFDQQSDSIVDQVCRFFFMNYRKHGGKRIGTRLTAIGSEILSLFFTPYEFEFEKKTATLPKYLILLSKVSNMPWYIDSSRIIFYEAELAFRYRLSGDIETFCNAFDDYSI